MKLRVGVLGGGSWGTTVGALASRNAPTIVWARRPEVADEIPKPEEFETNFSPAELITTRVDIRPYLATKRAALAVHSSQVDETSFFLQMPEELFAAAFSTEWFIRRGAPPGTQETWLFP